MAVKVAFDSADCLVLRQVLQSSGRPNILLDTTVALHQNIAARVRDENPLSHHIQTTLGVKQLSCNSNVCPQVTLLRYLHTLQISCIPTTQCFSSWQLMQQNTGYLSTFSKVPAPFAVKTVYTKTILQNLGYSLLYESFVYVDSRQSSLVKGHFWLAPQECTAPLVASSNQNGRFSDTVCSDSIASISDCKLSVTTFD